MKSAVLIFLAAALSLPSSASAWLPTTSQTTTPLGYSNDSRHAASSFGIPNQKQQSKHQVHWTTKLRMSDNDSTQELPDYKGKTLYQRTFFRLSSNSQVEIPNAMMIEERLRFKADPDRDGYILPTGPRTLILREGTADDELTDALFTMDILPSGKAISHNGPGSMDTEIAAILYLASNPQWIQGDVLELSCSGSAGASGVVGLLGCIAAHFTQMSPEALQRHKEQLQQSQSPDDIVSEVMTLPKHHRVFPKRMHHLTLSDESPEALRGAFEMVKKHFKPNQVSIKQLEWSVPRRTGNNRRYDHEYRTIIGSDLELAFPTAKELARTVANMLLPSNEFAVANIKEGATTAPSFGALGMDPEPSPTSYPERYDEEVDTSIPATFIHLCPDYRDEVMYLRQFLEKGFLMTVRSSYVKMERLQFVLKALPQDTPESELDKLDDLELQEEISRDYQSLTAIHHPDYAGDGMGEYFFPLETGTYEGGLSSTYMEPEEGGYLL
jgi:hypothetical protein